MEVLTPAQQEVVDFVRRWWREHGYGPTFDDIAAGLAISKRGAADHVIRLVKLGHLIRTPRTARSVRATEKEGG